MRLKYKINHPVPNSTPYRCPVFVVVVRYKTEIPSYSWPVRVMCLLCCHSFQSSCLEYCQRILKHILEVVLVLLGYPEIDHLRLVMRKPAFCICENKDADHLRGDREADQRLCFRYIASTIPLLPKYKISSL